MPFNDVGFYTKRRGLGGQGGVTPAPSRNLTITPTLQNNAERVVWTINSNMAAGIDLNYEITGANVETFFEGTLSGTITLNSSGGATIIRNLDKFYEYAKTSNNVINVNFYAPGSNVFLANATNNVVVAAANTFTATSSNTTNFTGGVDNLSGGYTLHTFEYTGANANLTVTNVGEYPSNSIIDVVAVGAGGAGGSAWWTNSPEDLTPAEITAKLMGSYQGYAGGGGAGGNVNVSNINAVGFNLANYTVRVGQRGFAAGVGPSDVATAGGPTWFAATSNIVATGGAAGETSESLGTGGSDGGASSPYLKGNEASRTYSGITRFTWTERTGGGGAGAAANGGNATISTGVNGASANDGYGGAGGAGRSFTITGNVITAGGGGGGGTINNTNQPAQGGIGGGGNGAEPGNNATTGSLGGGGGGGGGGAFSISGSLKSAINYYTNPADGVDNLTIQQGANGGNGILYIRYLSKYRRLSIQS